MKGTSTSVFHENNLFKVFYTRWTKWSFLFQNSHIRLYIHLKDITTRDSLKLRLKQSCAFLRWNLQRRTTSNQRYNVRQRRNNVVIFDVEFHNVRQSRNSVVEMTIFKKNKKKIISSWMHWIQSFNYYFIILLTLLPILSGIYLRIFAKPHKILKYWIARA